MAATAKQFNKVGFTPRQAAAIPNRLTLTTRQLLTAGFFQAQVVVLKKVTPTTAELIKQARFTRQQASLVLVP